MNIKTKLQSQLKLKISVIKLFRQQLKYKIFKESFNLKVCSGYVWCITQGQVLFRLSSNSSKTKINQMIDQLLYAFQNKTMNFQHVVRILLVKIMKTFCFSAY